MCFLKLYLACSPCGGIFYQCAVGHLYGDTIEKNGVDPFGQEVCVGSIKQLPVDLLQVTDSDPSFVSVILTFDLYPIVWSGIAYFYAFPPGGLGYHFALM